MRAKRSALTGTNNLILKEMLKRTRVAEPFDCCWLKDTEVEMVTHWNFDLGWSTVRVKDISHRIMEELWKCSNNETSSRWEHRATDSVGGRSSN